MSPWIHLTLSALLLLLHCHSRCHSTITPAVAWIVHGYRLKRQNQCNGFHKWLSGACAFLLIAVCNIVENSQGGNLITFYSSIEQLQLSLWLNLTLSALLLLLHCHFSCHSTVSPAVACIVLGCHLKRQKKGNGFYQWLSGVCVFLLIAVLDIIEKIHGGNLITLYSSIEQS